MYNFIYIQNIYKIKYSILFGFSKKKYFFGNKYYIIQSKFFYLEFVCIYSNIFR